MVEVGETAVLTDDRYQSDRIQDFGRRYPRGAWHLWHLDCHQQTRKESGTVTGDGIAILERNEARLAAYHVVSLLNLEVNNELFTDFSEALEKAMEGASREQVRSLGQVFHVLSKHLVVRE